MDHPKYVQIAVDLIPQPFMDAYKLHDKVQRDLYI